MGERKCKSCGKVDYTGRKNENENDYGYCQNPPCVKAKVRWLTKNWDQISEGRTRSVYENKFWQVTEVQREHYSTFFSLMREPPKVKTGLCLKCRRPLTSFKKATQGNRICAECTIVNQNVGELAYGSHQ